MPITNATNVGGADFPTGQSIQTIPGAVLDITADDSIAIGEKLYGDTVTTADTSSEPAANGNSIFGIRLNNAADELTVIATPIGLWVSGTTYADNDAVYTLFDTTANDAPSNRLWWIANTTARVNTVAPDVGVDGWTPSSISHEGSMYLTEAGMGSSVWVGSQIALGSSTAGGTLNAFNTTLNLNGGIYTTGTAIAYNLDEVVIYNHNDHQLWWRHRHGTDALPAASRVGHVILDGNEQGSFIYYPPHLGTASPTAITGLNGGIIGHAGGTVAGVTDTPIFRDLDFTRNRALRPGSSTIKFHLGLASNSGTGAAGLRTYEIRNSADGTDFAFSARPGNLGSSQKSGGGQITSEATFVVTDTALTPANLDAATVYVASQNETSFTEGGQATTLNVNVSTSAGLNDELTGDRLFKNNNNRTFTTNSSGTTGQQLMHLAYYQIPDGLGGNTGAAADQFADAVGNRLFMMHGNAPLTTVSKYGFAITQFNPDLRGVGAKTYTLAIPEDPSVIGDTAPTNVTDSFASNVLTSTLSADASLDDLRDAAHALEVNLAGSGVIVDYLAVVGSSLDDGADSATFNIAGTGNIVNAGAMYTSVQATTSWGGKNISDVVLSGGNHSGMGTTMTRVSSTGTGTYAWATGTSFNTCSLTTGTHTFNSPVGFVDSSVTQAITFGNTATVTGSTFTNAATFGTGSTITGNTFNGTVTTTGNLGVFDNTFVTAALVIDAAQDIQEWTSLPSGITKAAGPVVDVTLTEAQATALGYTIAQGASFTENNVRFAVPAAGVVTHAVAPEGTLAEITARGGWLAIWNETDSVAVLVPTNLGNISALSDVTFQKTEGDTDVWRIYHKPETTWGVGRTAYGMTQNADGTILSVGSITAPVSYGVNVHVSALTGDPDSITEPAAGVGTYKQNGALDNTFVLNIEIDTADGGTTDPALNGGSTQALSLEAANQGRYIQAHYFRNLTTEMFAPGANNESVWTGAGYIFTSGDDDATPPRQQIISQIRAGFNTQSPNGYNQVLGVTEGSATIATVSTAVAGAVTSGVDNSNVANATGWLVGNQTGVKLRRGNPQFMPGENYRGNLNDES